MKKYISLWMLFSVLLFSACESGFLDEDNNPNSLSPGTFWKSKNDIKKGLTSVYGRLQPSGGWAANYERYIVLDNYRSDEVDYRPDVASWISIANFSNSSTNGVSNAEWYYLYQGINFANQCIDNIPHVPNLEESERDLYIAEARCLRAYYYYRLYINYGERIPIFTTQLKGSEEEFYPPQAESGVLVKLIEDELIEAQKFLPENDKLPAGYDPSRVNKQVAAAFLAKFYMFRGELAKAEKEWAKLIGKYELMENYGDNFSGLHKNNKESVFEVQFSGDRTGGKWEANDIALHLVSGNAEGYEEAYPSYWLVDTFKAHDVTVDGEFSDRFYATILFDGPKTTAFYFEEGKQFTDYHNPDEVFWHKFATWDPSLSQHWSESAFNIPIVRYSDVLLSYAECLNDRGATAEAIQYINQVRARVQVPALEPTLSKEAVLKHLQDVERPLELALEGSRWHDLIRWGITQKALVDHKKPNASNFVPSKHILYPIPHGEFLLNDSWEQNSGFSK